MAVIIHAVAFAEEGVKLLRIIAVKPIGDAVAVGYAIANAGNANIALGGGIIYVLTGEARGIKICKNRAQNSKQNKCYEKSSF